MVPRSALAVALLALAAAAPPPGGAGRALLAAPHQPATRTVSTAEGPVVGLVDGGVAAWKGIPFAAAPVGELRWRPPRPAPRRDAPLEAFAFGPRCPQREAAPLGQGGSGAPVGEEDCLQLNVWASDGAAEGALPVLFWIHGGGFIQGSGVEPIYDGSALARARDVVVVTINYRLGALGFLVHPSFVGEDAAHPTAGNYGLLDQIAALEWVRANVAGFGGDPARVAIFGESAGGVSVCALLASPLAAGRFHVAIMQSGNCLAALPPLDGPLDAARQGERFARTAGCDAAPDVAACLRALPLDAVQATLPGEIGSLNPGAETYGPVLDRHALLEPPGEAVRAGRAHAVPFVAGATADEGSVFAPPGQSRAAFESVIRGLYPDAAERIVALYPATDYPDGSAALAAVYGDAAFVCPARRAVRDHAAHGRPSWLYHFTRVPRYAALAGLGAHHGVEIPYVFDSFGAALRATLAPADRAIRDRMGAHWAQVAAAGDPGEAGGLAWPPVAADPDAGLRLGDAIDVARGWRAERCDLWDEVAGRAPPSTSEPPATPPGTPAATTAPTTAPGEPTPTAAPTAGPDDGAIFLPLARR